MKKLLISLLTASVLLSSSVVAFADTTPSINQSSDPAISLNSPSDSTTTTTTTPQTISLLTQTTSGGTQTIKQERAAFYTQVYIPDMTSIVNLRVQTATAVATNNATSANIKIALKALKLKNNLSAQIKTAQQTVSDTEAQLKSISQQSKSLKSQLLIAIKTKNIDNMIAIQKQYQDLLTQINTLTQNLATDKAALKSLQSQVSNTKTQLPQEVQSLLDQSKSLAVKIKQEEQAKNQLWKNYNSEIKANDFTSAGNTLQSIISAKTQILQDINSRGEVLNQLLTTIQTLQNQ